MALTPDAERKSRAGRKPFDAILMFRMLMLQSLYNLSDEQIEYQVRDRMSFTRFLGLEFEDDIPDGTTLWLFREKLAQAGLVEKLFERFNQHLNAKGYIARGGQMVDATIVPVPKQRNTREENETVKRGETPVAWEERPAKNRQKDKDARWTKKHGKSFFGYKNACLSGCHPQPLAVVFGHAHGRSPAWQSSVPTIAPRVPATFSRRRGLRRLPGEGSLERRVCLPPLSGGGRAVPLRKSSWRLALPQVPP